MHRLIPALACTLLASSAVADVVREGSGERREQLDRLELKPFDSSLIQGLSGWTTETPVTAGDLSGKVVLLVTWASWYTPSHQVLPLAQDLARKHGDDLVVIGVHHPKGYESAPALAKGRSATFPIAHDATGAFRSALLVDQDPDFYVVDRAGQLRFADIATGSVTEAVEMLIGESRADASTVNERLEQQRREADALLRRTGGINQELDLRSLPEIPFTPPSPGEWEAVKDRWPEFREDNRSRRRGGDAERKLSIPEAFGLRPSRPATNGRALVVYFWHPDLLWTHERSMAAMERLQKQKGRDIAVIGVLTPREERSRRNDEDEDGDSPERLARVFRDTLRTTSFTHSMGFDPEGAILGMATGGSSRGNRFEVEVRMNAEGSLGAPAAIVSSDGTVRWFGLSSDPRFIGALDTVLRIDPGIEARRAAEDHFIRTQGG